LLFENWNEVEVENKIFKCESKFFFILLGPLEAILALLSPIIDQAALSQKLFFADFVKKSLLMLRTDFFHFVC